MTDNIYNDTTSSNVASFDVAALGVNTTVSLAGDFGSAKAAIAAMIEEGNALAAQQAAYKEQYVVRGYKALYELLEKIYGYALCIDSSRYKQKILDGLRKDLKDVHGVKVTKKTPWLTIVVKTVVRSDRQTASNYSRVLQVAFNQNMGADGLATYIESAGGLNNVRDEVKVQAEKLKGDELKRRTKAVKNALVNRMYCKTETLESNIPVLSLPKARVTYAEESLSECGEMVVFLTQRDLDGSYGIIGAFEFSADFEEKIWEHIQYRLPYDTEWHEKMAARLEAIVKSRRERQHKQHLLEQQAQKQETAGTNEAEAQ